MFENARSNQPASPLLLPSLFGKSQIRRRSVLTQDCRSPVASYGCSWQRSVLICCFAMQIVFHIISLLIPRCCLLAVRSLVGNCNTNLLAGGQNSFQSLFDWVRWLLAQAMNLFRLVLYFVFDRMYFCFKLLLFNILNCPHSEWSASGLFCFDLIRFDSPHFALKLRCFDLAEQDSVLVG